MMNSHTIELRLEQRAPLAPPRCSPRVRRLSAMFGLPLDGGRERTLIPPLRMRLIPGELTFITGESGGGKTTLLQSVRRALAMRRGVRAVELRDLRDVEERPVVDALDAPPGQTLRRLSLAGLSDAFVLTRRVDQLSAGQACRLQLARAISEAERTPGPVVLLVDELASTLDRVRARALARCIRKWTTRGGAMVIAASVHDELLEPLCPDVLIEARMGGRMQVITKSDARG